MTEQATMTTELVGDTTLVMSRSFNARRELVFQCYADCQHLMNWWGPREWPLAVCEMDFRPGGTWHYCMRGPNGEESWGIGTYREIAEPERLVYTDAFSDAERSTIPPESLITIEFQDQGATTLVKFTTEYATKSDRDTVIEMGIEEGFSETLDRLDEYLETLS